MVDIAQIKEKLAQLKGERRDRNSWRWKPDLGEHLVRLLPWPDDPNNPIKERYFYYNIGKQTFLSPRQFDKPDPVQEFISELYKENTEESKELAKKLYASLRGFVPVLVREEEDKGVRLWNFSPTVYQRILGFFVNKEIGFVNDPVKGRDLVVNVTKADNKKYQQCQVDPSFTARPLSQDQGEMQKWLDSIPSLDDKFELKSYDVIKKALDDWLAGDDEEQDDSDGTERSGPTNDSDKTLEFPPKLEKTEELDELFKQLETDDDELTVEA